MDRRSEGYVSALYRQSTGIDCRISVLAEQSSSVERMKKVAKTQRVVWMLGIDVGKQRRNKFSLNKKTRRAMNTVFFKTAFCQKHNESFQGL